MSNKKFTPVRGIEDKIAGHVMGFHDGFVYFATDTGKIYMDYTDEEGVDHARVPFGGGAGGGSGSNSGIFFAKRPVTEDEKLDDNLVFSMDDHIEGKVYPEKDDLILTLGAGNITKLSDMLVLNLYTYHFRPFLKLPSQRCH